MPRKEDQSSPLGQFEACDPKRFGKSGVMRCPHGCVTECARQLAERTDLKAQGERLQAARRAAKTGPRRHYG